MIPARPIILAELERGEMQKEGTQVMTVPAWPHEKSRLEWRL
jgi:hypothetical protein